jgi:hypothetical protein
MGSMFGSDKRMPGKFKGSPRGGEATVNGVSGKTHVSRISEM